MRRFLALFLLMALFCCCVDDSPKITTTTTTTTLSCNDSDGGKSYLVKGFVSGCSELGDMGSETDYCINSDQLLEYFCDDLGYMQTDLKSCKSEGMVCFNGRCAGSTTTTSTSTSTTTSTTTTTRIGECETGTCGDASVSYRCKWDFDEFGKNFTFVQRFTVIPYCADPGTVDAKCKNREIASIEDRCGNYEVCVEGMQVCQTSS